jgi:hypothetical protein
VPVSGSKYSVIWGDGNHPMNFVTFYDTLRFANWLDNGQGSGSTETGAYTLFGGHPCAEHRCFHHAQRRRNHFSPKRE